MYEQTLRERIRAGEDLSVEHRRQRRRDVVAVCVVAGCRDGETVEERHLFFEADVAIGFRLDEVVGNDHWNAASLATARGERHDVPGRRKARRQGMFLEERR